MGTRRTALAKPNSSGLDLEKTSRLRSRQNFFLDFLIELIQLGSFMGGFCLAFLDISGSRVSNGTASK